MYQESQEMTQETEKKKSKEKYNSKEKARVIHCCLRGDKTTTKYSPTNTTRTSTREQIKL